jgi:hypothetical protein
MPFLVQNSTRRTVSANKTSHTDINDHNYFLLNNINYDNALHNATDFDDSPTQHTLHTLSANITSYTDTNKHNYCLMNNESYDNE